MGGFVRYWRLLKIWRKVIGDNLYKQTEPAYIKDNVLFVRVDNPSRADGLSYIKDEILIKLNNELKGKPVKDIRFSIGSIRPLEYRKKKKFDLSQIAVDEKEVNKCIDHVALKNRPKLRKLCENFVKNSYRRRKYLDDKQSSRSGD